jgi:hypothetical protein
MTTWLKFVAISAVLGVLMETLARALRMWTYTPPRMVVFNVIATVGLLFGTLAWLTRGLPVPVQFLSCAVVGIAYEALNFAGLNAWIFPGDRLGPLKGKTALTLGVGLAWGLYPVLTNLLVKLLVQG